MVNLYPIGLVAITGELRTMGTCPFVLEVEWVPLHYCVKLKNALFGNLCSLEVDLLSP